MLRADLLRAVLATTTALGGEDVLIDHGSDSPPGGNLLSFRYVIPVGPYRVALLANAGSVALAQPGNGIPKQVNLPRPDPGQNGWRPGVPPATPYVNPGWDTGKNDVARVVQRPGPDEVTVAWATGPYAVFGFRPSPLVVPQAYLLRVAPVAGTIETRWVPEGFDGSAIAMFMHEGMVNIVDQNARNFPDPTFFSAVST